MRSPETRQEVLERRSLRRLRWGLMALVTIHSDGIPPRGIQLRELVTTLGRSVDNVLEVPDANMSRRHCVIERRSDGDFILTDCNSSNGTRVNGERVLSHELRDGDRIEAG